MSDFPRSPTDVPSKVYNIEMPPYGAIPSDWFTDGVATNGSTTFTSATAAFVSTDAGKTIVVEKADGENLAMTTTISSVTNGTTVVLADAPGGMHTSPRSSTKFYIARGGVQTSKIQQAIDDCAAKGGGTVLCPGVAYYCDTIVLKRNVELRGSSRRGTTMHTAKQALTKPHVYTDYTNNDSATVCRLRHITFDGAGDFQPAITSSLGAAYTAGNATITLATGDVAAKSVMPAGTVEIGATRMNYSGLSGDVLQNVEGGVEGTIDSNYSLGVQVTLHQQSGFFSCPVPINTEPTIADQGDAHHLVEDVYFRGHRSYGIYGGGLSEVRYTNVIVHGCYQAAFRPSYDSWLTNCTAVAPGRMGFMVRGSSSQGAANKAFGCGTFDGNSTTLNGSMTNVTTTMVITSAVFPSAGQFYLVIEDGTNTEVVKVTGGQGTTSLTVTRGEYGTTAVAHVTALTVRLYNSGHGFFFEGPSNIEEGTKAWVGCNSQDNYGHGFYIRNAQRVNVQGTASTNSNRTGGLYSGICLDGSASGIYTIPCVDRAGTTTQKNAVDLQEQGAIPNLANTIIVSNGGTGANYAASLAAVGPAVSTKAKLLDSSNVIIANGVIVFGGPTIFKGGSVLSPAASTNVYVWRADRACKVLAVKGIRRGGTGATINARRNGSGTTHLSSALSLTGADTWMDGGAISDATYAAGDRMEIMVVTVAGSPTEVAIQLELTPVP